MAHHHAVRRSRSDEFYNGSPDEHKHGVWLCSIRDNKPKAIDPQSHHLSPFKPSLPRTGGHEGCFDSADCRLSHGMSMKPCRDASGPRQSRVSPDTKISKILPQISGREPTISLLRYPGDRIGPTATLLQDIRMSIPDLEKKTICLLIF